MLDATVPYSNDISANRRKPRSGGSVVLVSRDERLLNSQERLLEAFGHTSMSFSELDEALDAASVSGSALCIDLQDMDGSLADCLDRLKQDFEDVPTILLDTAMMRGLSRSVAAALPNATLLMKPIDTTTFLSAVRAAIRRPSERRTMQNPALSQAHAAPRGVELRKST